MLNRLLTALATVSLALALTVAVLWWRADHGHTDTFHLGTQSSTQTSFTTLPGGRVAIEVGKHEATTVHGELWIRPLRSVMGYCLFVPGLWVAVKVRRRLAPRPPGSQLPALRSR